jgi:hypothetical protein
VRPAVPGCAVALPVLLALPVAELPDVGLDGGVLLELLHAATVRDIAASPAAIAVTERMVCVVFAVRAERAVRRCLNLLMCF